jgi:integrase
MNTLYDQHGHRKYLTPAERDAFLKAADESEVREVRTFCATLAYTGCRISEALALTADRIDLKKGAIVIEIYAETSLHGMSENLCSGTQREPRALRIWRSC